MDIHTQRSLLLDLGFTGGEVLPWPQEVAERFGPRPAKDRSTFIKQQGQSWPYSSGMGVSAITTDGGVWYREMNLTPSEEAQLISAGFRDQSLLAEWITNTHH